MADKKAAAMHDGFAVGDLVTVTNGTAVYRIAVIDDQLDAAKRPYRMARLETDGGRDTRSEETTRLRHTRTK